MATLEKIRSKSTLLLIVVGAALLAFIIGDFFTSGRTLFGTGTTIAKVGNEKIDIQEFQRRYEEVNQQYQQQNTKMDPAALQQYVLNQMIQERLINKEIEDLGIEVTDNELSKAMLGPNAHYAMIQFAQQMGFQSPDQLYDVAFNPTKYNVPADQAQQIQALWLNQEHQMAEMLKQQKLQYLLASSIVANDLDAKAFYDSNASTSHIIYAHKNYADVPNDQYEVTSADILTLASMARAGKAIGMEQENIIVNAIRLSHSPATTAMIPREKIRYIINGISLEENEKRLGGVLTNTRYPLCSEDSIDSIIGTINHKKFALAHGEKSSDFTSMARELILINPDVTLLQALQTMIRAKSHMIFVKGGDGKIAGLLTLEDITDELVDVALPD